MHRAGFHRGSTFAVVVTLALLGASAGTATAQKEKPPTRVSKPAVAKSLNAALQIALAKPNLRQSVKLEVLRQLRVSRPLAFVNGYWVSPIDLTGVYQLSDVRTDLLASLGPSGPQLIGAASNVPDDIGLVFTPSVMAKLLFPDMTRDMTNSVGTEALQKTMTDLVGIDDLIVVTVLVGGAVAATMGIMEWVHHHDSEPGPAPPTVDTGTGDMDNDGKPDYMDDDNDGDGTADGDDSYPNDASKSICDCGRVRGMVFARSVKGDVLASLGAALAAARAPQAARMSLGPVSTGSAGTIAIMF